MCGKEIDLAVPTPQTPLRASLPPADTVNPGKYAGVDQGTGSRVVPNVETRDTYARSNPHRLLEEATLLAGNGNHG
jgi:hypothetical protein